MGVIKVKNQTTGEWEVLERSQGAPGKGLPVGGAKGQLLIKKSAADYDYDWKTLEDAGDMNKSVYDPTNRAKDIFGYVDGKVKTDVPENAKFTDTTYSEITEAEIDAGTASTLRTITARRVTFILSKVSTLISNAISALTKSDVGLSNVDNVKQIPMSQKGSNSGVAELDAAGKVPANQLPSFVDDVLEFASLQNFPASGESGKIYIAINQNLAYRWSGTGYVEISQGMALGETVTTAYRGDRGKIAYDHSQSAHAPVNAQKNSDITKTEIENKLTGKITTHTHDYMSINDWIEVANEPPANADPNKIYYTVE